MLLQAACGRIEDFSGHLESENDTFLDFQLKTETSGHLKDENPKLYNAIMFARENISPKDGILEIVGEWGNYAQISSSTGIPNIINWPGHQIQWRGQSQEIEQRIEDVRVIYESKDHELTKRLLANYEVKYIYIGSSTNHNYSEVNLGKFNEIGDLVFGDQDGPRIYRIRE